MSKDLIKRSDAIKVTWQEPTYTDPLNVLTEVRDRIEAIPSADRPQGDVDAVDIFGREMHNLEQGYITIGEFDERIEPLRHLCYGRPQGEWIPCSERLPSEDEQDPELGVIVTLGNGYGGLQYDWYHDGRWYDWNGFVVAWTPLPKPWKGADDDNT